MDVVQTVIEIRIFLSAKGSKHRQFQEFHKGVDADYSDTICFSKVRELNWDQILGRFYVIKSFMASNAKFVAELDDENWLTNLVVLVDSINNINKLKPVFKVKPIYRYNVLIHNRIQWKAKKKKGGEQFYAFYKLAKHSSVSGKKHVALLFYLMQELENRFHDFQENILKLHF